MWLVWYNIFNISVLVLTHSVFLTLKLAKGLVHVDGQLLVPHPAPRIEFAAFLPARSAAGDGSEVELDGGRIGLHVLQGASEGLLDKLLHIVLRLILAGDHAHRLLQAVLRVFIAGLQEQLVGIFILMGGQGLELHLPLVATAKSVQNASSLSSQGLLGDAFSRFSPWSSMNLVCNASYYDLQFPQALFEALSDSSADSLEEPADALEEASLDDGVGLEVATVARRAGRLQQADGQQEGEDEDPTEQHDVEGMDVGCRRRRLFL